MATSAASAEEVLFRSRPLTQTNSFTRHIEGPSVDRNGDLFVPNLSSDGTVGRVKAGQSKPEIILKLPSGSIANGTRFDRLGRMFLADYAQHAIFVVKPGNRSADIYFQSRQFHQPNDLAIASDGTLYASDPSFRERSGRVWRIGPNASGQVIGSVMEADRTMGVANGLDLSPDERTLYVSESNTSEIWAYSIENGRLAAPHKVVRFDRSSGGELDGLRVDATGRILVARPGAGLIALVEPSGQVVREIKAFGPDPTNLTFGGDDGRTVFVTNAATRAVEQFRSNAPGREFCWNAHPTCPAMPR